MCTAPHRTADRNTDHSFIGLPWFQHLIPSPLHYPSSLMIVTLILLCNSLTESVPGSIPAESWSQYDCCNYFTCSRVDKLNTALSASAVAIPWLVGWLVGWLDMSWIHLTISGGWVSALFGVHTCLTFLGVRAFRGRDSAVKTEDLSQSGSRGDGSVQGRKTSVLQISPP